jgi:hypothetical protein
MTKSETNVKTTQIFRQIGMHTYYPFLFSFSSLTVTYTISVSTNLRVALRWAGVLALRPSKTEHGELGNSISLGRCYNLIRIIITIFLGAFQ